MCFIQVDGEDGERARQVGQAGHGDGEHQGHTQGYQSQNLTGLVTYLQE